MMTGITLQDLNYPSDMNVCRRAFIISGRYLYIRGLHDRAEVLEGRLKVLQYIMSEGEDKLDLKKSWEEGVLDLRCGGGCLPFMEVRVHVSTGRRRWLHALACTKRLGYLSYL